MIKKTTPYTIAMVLSMLLLVLADSAHGEGKKVEIVMHNDSAATDKKSSENPTIIVAYDNNPHGEGLTTSWGFSCVIRGMEKTILFDTGGNGSILLKNMQKLAISPKELDLVVISHAHGDHTGGLGAVLEKNAALKVFLPGSFPKIFKRKVEEYGAKAFIVTDFLQIVPNAYSTGELGTSIKEQALIIRTKNGLVVITGCAHPGIVQIVKRVRELIPGSVLLVMGGFHLGENRDRIREIIRDFRKLGVQYVGPCHCSGEFARRLFAKEYGQNYINVGVGTVIAVDELH